jgi:RimJ/RimL family protein N-acetyltransferase
MCCSWVCFLSATSGCGSERERRGRWYWFCSLPEVGFAGHTEQRGKGIMTEVVNMMVRYLFEAKQMNRIRLVIHPDNAASRRLAEKCGFKHEGTARGAWYNKGRHNDVEIYSILHDAVIKVG